MNGILRSITNTPGYTVVILFGYCTPWGLKLNSPLTHLHSLSVSPVHSCKPYYTPFLRRQGLHEYIISSLDRPKESSCELQDEASGLQNEFFSLNGQLTLCVGSCRCMHTFQIARVCVRVFFDILSCLCIMILPTWLLCIDWRYIQIHDPAPYYQQGSAGQNSTASLSPVEQGSITSNGCVCVSA